MIQYLWESRAGIQEEDAEMSQFLSSLQRKRPAIAGQLVVCKNFFLTFKSMVPFLVAFLGRGQTRLYPTKNDCTTSFAILLCKLRGTG
jgi:hypothetical protein